MGHNPVFPHASSKWEVPRVPSAQMELGVPRLPEADRNLHLGGRSFYFFDFDDNVAFLTTPLVLFHKSTRVERVISSEVFAQEHGRIGKSGPFADYEIDWDDRSGTFRNFRDHSDEELLRLGRDRQVFLHDVAHALGLADFVWKGPSWETFYHATFNQRPIAVITARGHHPETIAAGIDLFRQAGHLPASPNFLAIYPVNHPDTRRSLGDLTLSQGTAELKQAAIRAAVERALAQYGPSPHHRFGMSDDDPKNLQLITEEMARLKSNYPSMGFFTIETTGHRFEKREILAGPSGANSTEGEASQISLF